MVDRLKPTGVCWCGCGQQPNPGSFFLAGHDRTAEAAVILKEYGSIPAFLERHGYGPGGKNASQVLAQLQHAVPQNYAPLAAWLAASSRAEIGVRMGAIEEVMGDHLPPAARTHRAWWSNSPQRHPQAKAWLHAGWRVEAINLKAEKVAFRRATGWRCRWQVRQ